MAPTLAEDVYSAISCLIAHAKELGVDGRRIAVMGDSGGGAPAAGAAILARDRNVLLAGQILIYPMLDDRQPNCDRALEPFLTWTYDDNFTAWSAALGEACGTDDVAPTAAPARLTDFRGLPATYLDVGDLDILRDEGIAFAQSLARAGVPVELHVHPVSRMAGTGLPPNRKWPFGLWPIASERSPHCERYGHEHTRGDHSEGTPRQG
jgi:acetyl esterase/lipase